MALPQEVESYVLFPYILGTLSVAHTSKLVQEKPRAACFLDDVVGSFSTNSKEGILHRDGAVSDTCEQYVALALMHDKEWYALESVMDDFTKSVEMSLRVAASHPQSHGGGAQYEEMLNEIPPATAIGGGVLPQKIRKSSSRYSAKEKQKEQEQNVVSELKRKYGDALSALQAGYVESKKKRRNLSKGATEILNRWFFLHLHDPYPTDEEKYSLSEQTGLSIGQCNNWFGNKRMRYKRKMLDQARRATNPNAVAGLVPPNAVAGLANGGVPGEFGAPDQGFQRSSNSGDHFALLGSGGQLPLPNQ